MPNHDDTIRSLREALAASPQNAPLRRLLADVLSSAGRFDEAVTEYRAALALAPQDGTIRLALARAYLQAGNPSVAFVIVEEILKQHPAPAAAHLLHCRLFLGENKTDAAARAYRQAVETDPNAADAALAASLGVDPITGLAAATDSDPDAAPEDRVRLTAQGEETGPLTPDLERPTITFADIGGLEGLKEEIRLKILHPLTHPDLYKAYGKAVGGGILVYGPPGCGKTYLARATAGEVKASFLSVGIEDVLNMWLGQSEQNLHELFQTARRHAPCVLFFDEVDALGSQRSDMRSNSTRMLINQFLSELDGVKQSNEGVLVLGATNAPWHMDSAFRRPGRFDRVLFVPPPDGAARIEILRVHLKDRPVAEIDYETVSAKTAQFSGADLKAVIDLAIEGKLAEAMRRGQALPLTTADLLAAAKRHRPTTAEWFATARNYALYSNEGGIYDDVLRWLKMK
jgi:transitional endoplasmic reticulum ATPase